MVHTYVYVAGIFKDDMEELVSFFSQEAFDEFLKARVADRKKQGLTPGEGWTVMPVIAPTAHGRPIGALKVVPLPKLGPKAFAYFTGDRPSHYLMLRVDAPDLSDGQLFDGCRGMIRDLQRRAAIFRGKDPDQWNNGMFPEARTHQDWGRQFCWEFWWNDGGSWDVDGLWNALNTGDKGTFEDLFLSELARWA